LQPPSEKRDVDISEPEPAVGVDHQSDELELPPELLLPPLVEPEPDDVFVVVVVDDEDLLELDFLGGLLAFFVGVLLVVFFCRLALVATVEGVGTLPLFG
jgi:hypothetical protein